jgi:hypothetical protein
MRSNKAAIITKFKAPDTEKPVIRPYTPVSDEGNAVATQVYFEITSDQNADFYR